MNARSMPAFGDARRGRGTGEEVLNEAAGVWSPLKLYVANRTTKVDGISRCGLWRERSGRVASLDIRLLRLTVGWHSCSTAPAFREKQSGHLDVCKAQQYCTRPHKSLTGAAVTVTSRPRRIRPHAEHRQIPTAMQLLSLPVVVARLYAQFVKMARFP